MSIFISMSRRLVLYPNGKNNSDGNGHISLYLAIAHTNDLPLGWEVNVNIRFFVFDQIRDKYLTIQGSFAQNLVFIVYSFTARILDLSLSLKKALLALCASGYTSLIYLCWDLICDFKLPVNVNNLDANGRVRRFHNLKTEWGFAQLLSHDTLNDPSNGYLLDDTCVFGVEVFVIKATGKGETLSMINQPQHNYFTWRIDNYSNLKGEAYFSEHFTVEGRRWYDCSFALLYQSQVGLLILLVHNL
jgi:hypothetical protein